MGFITPGSALTLALLVLGVLADDHNSALALDDLALFTHGLNGRSYFHDKYLHSCKADELLLFPEQLSAVNAPVFILYLDLQVILPLVRS